jgi:uncharacterized OB-fold protein
LSVPAIRQPELVTAPSGETGGVKLRARRCTCGHLFFPSHVYGCERCGRDGASTHGFDLEPRGRLEARATIYEHPKLAAPFLVGRVILDAGLTLAVRLTRACGDLPPGARVRGALVSEKESEGGATWFDLHFEPDGERP